MDPNLGRFHTLDTYQGRNQEPLTLHKYLYTHGNPVSNIDPSGNLGLIATALAPTVFLVGDAAFKNFQLRLQTTIATTLFKLLYIHLYMPQTIIAFKHARLDLDAAANQQLNAGNFENFSKLATQAASAGFFESKAAEFYGDALLSTAIGVPGTQAGIAVGSLLLFNAMSAVYEGAETALDYSAQITRSRFTLIVDYPKSVWTLASRKSSPELIVKWSTELAIADAVGGPTDFLVSELRNEYEKHGKVLDHPNPQQ